MRVVTGTKRSGTSLWMRVLIASGCPHIGDPFPATWGRSLRQRNPYGFFESHLRQGVSSSEDLTPYIANYHADLTSPAVKIFIPGLCQTPSHLLVRTIVSLRHWSTYGPSLQALYADEDAYFTAHPPTDPAHRDALQRMRARRSPHLPELQWILEYSALAINHHQRGYPLRWVSYDQLLNAPERVLSTILPWLGLTLTDASVGCIVYYSIFD